MEPSKGRGAALELKDLHKHYGHDAVVRGVSLTASPGEFLTFLGPSGSGKTTTLNMVAGLVSPSSGRIVLDGRDIAHLPPRKRNIGMVFQHYALFPHMTAFENVAFPLRQRKVPRDEITSRVSQSLEMVGLGGRAKSYPRELSGGQQQRVALARAMVFEPALLLMDEPLGALDRQLREQMQLEIKRLHRELGITFVYVTHDQDEALVMSDRVVIFNHGSIEQVGSPTEVYEAPSSLFVAQFLGDSNCVPVEVEPKGHRAFIRALGTLVQIAPGERGGHGRSAVLMIRPERLRVDPSGVAVDTTRNRLEGEVRELVYLGAARRLDIALGGGLRIVAREQTGAWSSVREGDRVQVSWDPADSVLLGSNTPDLEVVA
jgi:putative spermidine/putrescine transport system ATP-binding protein